MSATRKALSKSTRFEIFKRDGFKCVYCGATPTDAPLHVDHIHPVAEGGGNEPENLVTACQACNSGKGATPLERKKIENPQAELIEEQRDHIEQLREYLALQKQIRSAKDEVLEMVLSEWECQLGAPNDFIRQWMPKLLKEWPVEKLLEAIEITSSMKPKKRTAQSWYATKQGKYFWGILRNWREGDDGGSEDGK